MVEKKDISASYLKDLSNKGQADGKLEKEEEPDHSPLKKIPIRWFG